MKKLVVLFSILLISAPSFSHSGRTDSSGGHNCSQKSQDKGLCTGYHYHGKVDIKPIKDVVSTTKEKNKETEVISGIISDQALKNNSEQ
jgi:hypothetical protein